MRKRMKHLLAAALLLAAVKTTLAVEEIQKAKEVIQVANKVVTVGAPVLVDKIEIRVGNEIITTQDIELPLAQFREQLSVRFRGAELEAEVEEARKKHIERLIEAKLLLLEARDQEIELKDTLVEEQVEKEIRELRAQFPTHQAYQEQLAQEHLTEAEFKQQRKDMVHVTMLRQQLLQSKIREFKTGIEVSDAQLQKYYESHKDKFYQPSRAKIRQIFVARPDTGLPEAEFKSRYQAARIKIQTALNELKAGKSFENVARRYSEHKPSADKGGDIGWIEEDAIGLPAFEKASFQQLEIGQQSEILDTVRGFFIVRLEDKQPGGLLPLVEVRGRIRQEMMAESSEKRYHAWLDTLKKKYKVQYTARKE
jgi:parvulin-like peptidyl-prolyl isomerase